MFFLVDSGGFLKLTQRRDLQGSPLVEIYVDYGSPQESISIYLTPQEAVALSEQLLAFAQTLEPPTP